MHSRHAKAFGSPLPAAGSHRGFRGGLPGRI